MNIFFLLISAFALGAAVGAAITFSVFEQSIRRGTGCLSCPTQEQSHE